MIGSTYDDDDEDEEEDDELDVSSEFAAILLLVVFIVVVMIAVEERGGTKATTTMPPATMAIARSRRRGFGIVRAAWRTKGEKFMYKYDRYFRFEENPSHQPWSSTLSNTLVSFEHSVDQIPVN